jgi:DNA-binding transcriptional regulator GbsR (MarR family)
MDKDDGGSRSHFAAMHFVEDMGLLLERSGIPRMAGRIIGWLLICNPPYQSAQQLAQALGASKASISTMTRLLIEMGLIEQVGVPGQRRDYFHIKPGAWDEVMRETLDEIVLGRQLVDRGLELLEGKPAELKQRLREAREVYAFFEAEYPALLERWERQRKKLARQIGG